MVSAMWLVSRRDILSVEKIECLLLAYSNGIMKSNPVAPLKLRELLRLPRLPSGLTFAAGEITIVAITFALRIHHEIKTHLPVHHQETSTSHVCLTALATRQQAKRTEAGKAAQNRFYSH